MAFIRAYTAQGDPRFRLTTMRAGRLMHAKILSSMRGRRGTKRRRVMELAGDHLHAHAARRYAIAEGDPFLREMRMPAGDPFRLRMPKFIRKLSIKKVIAGVKKVGPIALQLGAGFLTGGASVAVQALSQIGSQALAEHAQNSTGTPGQVAATYGPPPPGPADTAPYTAPYSGARSRMAPGALDEDEDEDQDEGEEPAEDEEP